MQLAFCLYKYFPYGGLQRDFMKIALDCQAKGHKIRVYTLIWSGDIPQGFEVIIVPVTALMNHTRYKRYTDWVQNALNEMPVDCVVGINKMPGLDVYYAADSCYEEKARSQRSWLYRLLPRYKHFAEYEQAVFGSESHAEILMISKTQEPYFKKYYGTDPTRLHFLSPGISRDRIAPQNASEVAQDKLAELGIPKDNHLVLMVGSGFIKKGLGRALLAIKSLPDTTLAKTSFCIVGEDNNAPFMRQAARLGIRDNVMFLSGRDDIPQLMQAADVLLHPALDENAGIVLLEAIVAGLPVLATDICGYGHYVVEADVGALVSSPFDQNELNKKLLLLMQSDRRQEWQRNGRRFAETANIYSLANEAARIIESVGVRGQPSPNIGTLAFALFKYFPFGGLQRDFLRVAKICQARGFKIRVYTLSWDGDIPDGFELVVVPVTALTNHRKYGRFSEWINRHLQTQPVSAVVGFNKMPGLDVYYAADACYEDKARNQRSFFYRLLPRYKHFARFEKAVFDKSAATRILMISEVQLPLFQKYYDTPQSRFHLLPPGIAADRRNLADQDELRASLRQEFGIDEDQQLLLMIGSGFITKGVDRAIDGLKSLPVELRERTQLVVVGQDNPAPFLRQAAKLGLEKHVTIYSEGRSDIPRFLFGADLLVHPAYAENTGTVILEAMIAGLPVLVSDVCGYAHYVNQADAGKVLSAPFSQEEFDQMLLQMLVSNEKTQWRENGQRFGAYADIYSMPDRAVDVITETVSQC